jgi:hypothetical protein
MESRPFLISAAPATNVKFATKCASTPHVVSSNDGMVQDLLSPAAQPYTTDATDANAKDIKNILTNASASKRPHKPKPLVLVQSDFAIEAQGLV